MHCGLANETATPRLPSLSRPIRPRLGLSSSVSPTTTSTGTDGAGSTGLILPAGGLSAGLGPDFGAETGVDGGRETGIGAAFDPFPAAGCGGTAWAG